MFVKLREGSFGALIGLDIVNSDPDWTVLRTSGGTGTSCRATSRGAATPRRRAGTQVRVATKSRHPYIYSEKMQTMLMFVLVLRNWDAFPQRFLMTFMAFIRGNC